MKTLARLGRAGNLAFAGWMLAMAPVPLSAAPQDVEAAFNPNASGVVRAVVTQADGKILVGGSFTTLQPPGSASPVTRNRLARLNADGTLDAAFNPNPNSAVMGMAVQDDGKIILNGFFTSLQPAGSPSPISRSYLARLNADGTVDPAWSPNPNGEVICMALQADGKLLIGGDFTTVQPVGSPTAVPRQRIARLNVDGTLDTSFNPGADGFVFSIAPTPQGKILVGGSFSNLPLSSQNAYFVRLNGDGSTDTSFDILAGGGVRCIVLHPDGGFTIGGTFPFFRKGTTVHNFARMARFTSNLGVDTAYRPNPDNTVNSMTLQVDGKVLIAGSFQGFTPGGGTSVSRKNLARINADGSLDTTVSVDPSATVITLATQADGKILLGGEFLNLTPAGNAAVPRNRIARLEGNPATGSLQATSTGRILWSRGGGTAEINRALFELSSNGGTTWTPLGAGSPVTGGWEITGLSLPASGMIRASGRTIGGLYTASSGLVGSGAVSYSLSYADITLESPPGTTIADDSTLSLGGAASGGAASAVTPRVFTIRSNGTNAVTVSSVTVTGPDAADFLLDTTGLQTNLVASATTTFSIKFAPQGNVSRNRVATLRISSNAAGASSPYDVSLNGLGLSTTLDADGDGLNDNAEFALSGLGFDWQTPQPALVSALVNNAPSAGFYTAAQIQTLNVGTPLLQRDPATSQFKLTLGLKQSTTLQSFAPFPLVPARTTINAQGELEFTFPGDGGKRFYRVEGR